MEDINLNQNQEQDKRNSLVKTNDVACFNVIYEDENSIIPEIDNTDLLTFGMAFMQIRAREINKDNYDSVESNII